MVFRKDVSNRSEDLIMKEIRLQKKAAAIGVSPRIIGSDFKTYIDMEDLGEMCIADMYGENIKDMPESILINIYDILRRLYLECDIEYIDITPYNFIETNAQLWIIDFGDANDIPKKDPFLKELFQKGSLTRWNSEFY